MKSNSTEHDPNQKTYHDEEEAQHLVEKTHDPETLLKPHPVQNEEEEEEATTDVQKIIKLASLSGPILAESIFYLLWHSITLIFLNQTTKVTVYAALGTESLYLIYFIYLSLNRIDLFMVGDDNICYCWRFQRCHCEPMFS